MESTTTVMEYENAETALGRVIREQGRLKGWVAGQLGIGMSRLSRLISGERALRLDEAQRLSEILSVPIETFLATPAGQAPAVSNAAGGAGNSLPSSAANSTTDKDTDE